VQLLNKTNQFNLTTRRHSASDIYNIIDNGGMAFWISVKDRFGDSGISGACIVKKINNNEWIIDTFLLSCRIIGRKIETVFLHYVLERIRDTKGCIVYGDYIKTKKNLLVSGFYKDNGFSLLNDTEKKYWVFDLSKSKIKPPNFIKIKYSKK
jgi:FkbH-like protein